MASPIANPNLTESEQIKGFRDFLANYNKLSELCFSDCVWDFTTRKISKDETDWRCKGCFKRGVCWGDKEVDPSCPTCSFSVPRPDGKWQCTKLDDEAVEICPNYRQYEPLPKE